MQSDPTCSPAACGRGELRDGHFARPTLGAGDEPAPPRPDRRRSLGPSHRRRLARLSYECHGGHRQQRGRAAVAVAGVRGTRSAAAPRHHQRAELPAGRPGLPGRQPLAAHRRTELGGEAAPSAPAPAAAASGAQASILPSVLPPFPLPFPRRPPDGVIIASTADNRWSEVPSRGVARKNHARLPGSRWCSSARLDVRGRPAGEEKRPANPGRAAIYGLGVRVYRTGLGIDPDPSAPRPSAAPDAPQDVAR